MSMKKDGSRSELDSMYSGTWSPDAKFVPAKECMHCAEGVTHAVAPQHWPIDTVAKVCYACGRVHYYKDNLLLMSEREAVIEYQSKPFAVRGGIAVQPSSALVARDLVLLGLEGGMAAAEVARELHCDLHYVEMVARHAQHGYA